MSMTMRANNPRITGGSNVKLSRIDRKDKYTKTPDAINPEDHLM